MRLDPLDWAYGMLIFALLALLMLLVGAPEWRWVSTAGLIFCCIGNIYANLRGKR